MSDGYATSTETVSITASLFGQRAIADPFDVVAVSSGGSLATPTSANTRELGVSSESTAGGVALTARGTTVRVVGEDGDTLRSYDLPHAISQITVSPDGSWVGVAHANHVSIINLATDAVAGTWPVSLPPYSIIIDDEGFAHTSPATGQWVNSLSFNPSTGEQVIGGRMRHRTQIQIHPSGLKAYGADTDLSPSDVERFDLSGGVFTSAYDSPYHGNYSFCGNLWIAGDGNTILTGCGVVVRATEDRTTDLTFVNQLTTTGVIVDAAYDANSGDWLVIETRNGQNELNVYDGESGGWKERIDIPVVTEGRFGIPLKVVTSADTDLITVYASDHQTNPLAYAKFTLADVDPSVLDFPPVAVVPGNLVGYVQDSITIDASQSYDPEGETLGYQWALVSEPNGSAVDPGSLDQSSLTFTPTDTGNYVFSLVVNDGERLSAEQTITVRAISAGEARQLQPLGTPSDVAYNKVTNQIIYTSADRNDVRIVDLDTSAQWVIEMDRPGQTVDVSPDGRYAAVSHTGMATLIEFGAGGGSVIDTQLVNADWGDIVVDDRAIAFLVPRRDQWVDLYAIDFGNSVVQTRRGPRAGTQIRMLPSGNAVYGANRGLSPSDIERYSVADINNMNVWDSPYHGDYSMSGNVWISETSDRLVVAGGHVFRTSEFRETDMRYVETLSPSTFVSWADHSQEAGRWVIVSNDTVRLFTDDTYLFSSDVDIPALFIDEPTSTPIIDRVYYTDDGDALIVVGHSRTAANDGYVVQILD